MTDKDPNMEWEMAHADDPNSLIDATQRSFVKSMRGIIEDVRKMSPGVPGLTWDQLEYLIAQMEKKKPHVIHQTEEM